MYIHQNIAGRSTPSVTLFEQKADQIRRKQLSMVKKQKAALLAHYADQEKAQEAWKNMQEMLTNVANQATKELQMVTFAGARTWSSSPISIQTKLNMEAKKMQDWITIIDDMLDQTKRTQTFTQAQIQNLMKQRREIQNTIARMNNYTQSGGEELKILIGEIGGFASATLGTLAEARQAFLISQLAPQAGVRLTGTEKGAIYQSKTSDYQMNFFLSAPQVGVSVKRTSHYNAKNIFAKVKTASLSSLLTAAGVKSGNFTNNLYTVLAHHGREKMYQYEQSQGQGEEVPSIAWSYNNFGTIIKSLHQIFLLTSLAGELNSGDFAAFMVINNKVFSIYDVFEQAGAMNKTSTASLSSNIAAKQKDVANLHDTLANPSLVTENDTMRDRGKIRSATVMRAINSMSVILTVRLNLALAYAAK